MTVEEYKKNHDPKTTISLSSSPINISDLQQSAKTSSPTYNKYGAMITFCGRVRQENQIDALCFEAPSLLFQGEVERVIREVRQKYDEASLGRVLFVHRMGEVEVGDVCSCLIVECVHVEEAVDVVRMICEGVKQKVPLWKRKVKGKNLEVD